MIEKERCPLVTNLIVPPLTQTIYRIENPVTMNGMWYNERGEYEPRIFDLTEGVSAHLPMGWHERYGQGGNRWFSGCSDVELLKHWFSIRDIMELDEAGYKLFSFQSTEFIHEEFQTLFTRRGLVEQVQLDITSLVVS